MSFVAFRGINHHWPIVNDLRKTISGTHPIARGGGDEFVESPSAPLCFIPVLLNQTCRPERMKWTRLTGEKFGPVWLHIRAFNTGKRKELSRKHERLKARKGSLRKD
ncbi:MAG: hypothetical protein BA861_06660 [Desulfobacterales bacterium S3730MH5]|nr:MAG: hypothetical protein BA861_06660 [Desulfobacterales bacterium S3730MH5]